MVKDITFVCQYFAPAWAYGGPPRVLYTLAKEFIKQGRRVKVITTDVLDEKRNPTLREKLDGIEIYRFRTISNVLSYKAKLFITPGILENTKDIIDKSDIVFFSDVRSIINWQLYPYVSKRKIPYGIFAFGEIPYKIGFKAIIKKVFDELWVGDFFRKASFRFAQTKHEQRMFHQYFNISLSETYLFPLPVEKIKYEPCDNLVNAFKNKWNIEDNDRILLFVGRLHYLKGIDILIKTVEPLLRNDKHLKLMIVGRDDGEEMNLRMMIFPDLNKQIIFTGPLYGKEAINAYKVATCFVFTPRHYEETSLAALEGLNFGVPVISTEEADIPYLEQYKVGLIVKNKPDVIRDAISKVIRFSLDNKTIVKQNAQKLIQDYYLPQTIIRKLLIYLDNLHNI